MNKREAQLADLERALAESSEQISLYKETIYDLRSR